MGKKKSPDQRINDTLHAALEVFLKVAECVDGSPSSYIRLPNSGVPPMFSDQTYDDVKGNLTNHNYAEIASSLYPLDNLISVISRKTEATESEAEDLADEAEQYGRDWIYDNYGKSDIEDLGDFLGEKVLDELVDWVEVTVLDRYDFPDQDIFADFVDSVIAHIDLGHVLSIADDILEAPTTMVEKLRDIGMSERDFL